MSDENYYVFILKKYISWLQDFIIANHNYSSSSELFNEFWKDEFLKNREQL